MNKELTTEKPWTLILIALALIGLMFLASTLEAKEGAEEVTLTGIIISADTDEDDNVIAVDLEVETVNEDGEEDTIWYTINPDKNGKKLFAYVDKKVKITGVLKIDDDGYEVLYVKSFTEIKEKQEKENDEE